MKQFNRLFCLSAFIFGILGAQAQSKEKLKKKS